MCVCVYKSARSTGNERSTSVLANEKHRSTTGVKKNLVTRENEAADGHHGLVKSAPPTTTLTAINVSIVLALVKRNK